MNVHQSSWHGWRVLGRILSKMPLFVQCCCDKMTCTKKKDLDKRTTESYRNRGRERKKKDSDMKKHICYMLQGLGASFLNPIALFTSFRNSLN